MRRTASFLLSGLLACLVAAGIFLSGKLDCFSVPWAAMVGAGVLPPAVAGGLLPFTLFLTLATVWVSLRCERRLEMILLSLAAILLLFGGSLVAALYGTLLDPLPGIMAIVVGGLSVLLFQQTAMGSREPVLRRLFGQRLRRQSFRKLVDSALPVDFPGEMHEASLLVCIVHNHVELMEAMTPSDYVALVNLYLREASDFLVDLGGYLDECSGESIRVIFGAPLPVEGAANHAAKAARASIDLVSRLEELNRECDARWQKRLDFRIGVNSGPMIAAAFGGSRAGRYSVSGPVVEFARHLSAACAQYGCRILSGPLTYEMASESVEGRPIDLLQRAGNRRRVEIYEFLAPKNSLSAERERSRDLFWKGVILFRERKWEESISAFSSARIPGIPDKALDHYLERVERARRGDDEPTPEQALLAEAV